MYNVKESQFVHQMPFLFSSGPSLHPFPLCCLHRATELSGSRVVSSSFHLHLANGEPQKEMKKRRRGKLSYFPLSPFCRVPSGWPCSSTTDHTHAKLALSPTLSFLVLGTLSSCCFKLRHANSHYKPRSTACHLVVFPHLCT